jgi:hypothetical protein
MSSTNHNLLEPKSGLVLAITFEILALYRNLVKDWEINCHYSTINKTYYIGYMFSLIHTLKGWNQSIVSTGAIAS